MNKKETRIEIDTIGKYEVEKNALYGSQTKRSFDTLKITNKKFDDSFIKAIITLKKAILKSNYKNKTENQEKLKASIESCEEVLNNYDKYKNNFITDQIQGGAGTSVNMNVNEVIANLATVKLGYKLGEYKVHPNDIINIGQSTNDIFPSAGKIVFYKETIILLKKLNNLISCLQDCSKRFDIIRAGKTHLQDAVPINMKRLFTSWGESIKRDIEKFSILLKNLKILNLGGTAIGTGISTSKQIVEDAYKFLVKDTNINFSIANDLIDSTRNIDIFLDASNYLKTFMTTMSKNANDLRLLSSGPSSGFAEILLPEIQPGSSIMPGKVNPIIPESINQIAFTVIGQNTTINYAVESGQLELNVFEPVIFSNLLESFRISIRSCDLLAKYVLEKIRPHKDNINKNIVYSSAYSTAFAKKYGYSTVSKIVHKAILENKNVIQEIISELKISKKEYSQIIAKENLCPLEYKNE